MSASGNNKSEAQAEDYIHYFSIFLDKLKLTQRLSSIMLIQISYR